MTQLVKHTSIMEISRLTERFQPDCIVFRQLGHKDPDELTSNIRLELPSRVWEDMGRAETITVTVYPKDTLNV